MTESEAKTKLCPMMLTNDRDTGHSLCEGSACMAWRPTDNEIKENPNGPIENGVAMKRSDYVSAGYCGLAGKP